MNELGEDLRSLLGCVSAEDHQLDPLGDSITHHDRALQSRVVSHWTSHHVDTVVQELANQTAAVSRWLQLSTAFTQAVQAGFTSCILNFYFKLLSPIFVALFPPLYSWLGVMNSFWLPKQCFIITTHSTARPWDKYLIRPHNKREFVLSLSLYGVWV